MDVKYNNYQMAYETNKVIGDIHNTADELDPNVVTKVKQKTARVQ